MALAFAVRMLLLPPLLRAMAASSDPNGGALAQTFLVGADSGAANRWRWSHSDVAEYTYCFVWIYLIPYK